MRRAALKTVLISGAILLGALWTANAALSARRLPVAPPIVVSTAYVERTDTMRRNETLSHLFGRHNIYGPELVDLLRAAEGLNPRRIRLGQVFRFRYVAGEARPHRVTVRLGDERILTLSSDSAGHWTGESEEILWSVHLERTEGSIQSSLYQTIESLIPDSLLPAAERIRLIDDLSEGVFGWIIDFSRDFYPGDRFNVLYERLTSPLGDLRYGRIVAAKLETRGRENSAYVMPDDRGSNVYYDDQGRSLRRAFKLSPLAASRITSRFSMSRFHPILRRRVPHTGVDYAAYRGSRIMATGSGIVTRAGRWGTYGIMVSIRHANSIETRYAHMSRLARGIKPGDRVNAGAVIGYVGMTGMANGPHVHYEFLKNGQHRDPRSVQRGDGTPIPADQRAEFESVKAHYDRLLQARRARVVAASPDN